MRDVGERGLGKGALRPHGAERENRRKDHDKYVG